MIRKRWEVPTLMVLLLGLGAWLVWAGKNDLYGIHPEPGAQVVEFRVGNTRGVFEISRPDDADTRRFRLLLRDGFKGPILSSNQFIERYGQRAHDDLLARGDNFLFRLFNITSWKSLLWASLGLIGQVAFFGRMFIQWIASERRAQSVVPTMFWWLSLTGGILLFTYFVWRQDFVGVLGQSTGIVIYARNLRLIAKQQRKEREQATNTSA